MTSPDPHPDVPAEHGAVDGPPAADPPTPPPTPPPAAPPAAPADTRRQGWLSRRYALGLAGAFLLGACLCGGAGLAIGAVVAHHGSNVDGRDGWHGRDNDRRRGDDDRRATTPTTPATTAPTTSPS